MLIRMLNYLEDRLSLKEDLILLLIMSYANSYADYSDVRESVGLRYILKKF